MHGMIHMELKKYVETKHGSEAWNAVLKEAGVKGKIYMPISTYPDEEAVAIVTAASKLTKVPAENILEDFGEFITPDLMNMYRSVVDPKWKTLEMLLHTEEAIHRVVKTREPGAAPPQLNFTKISSNKLRFFYNSPRRMAAVAKGIMKGVAKHYGETISIQETKNTDGSSEMIITIT